MAKKTIRIVVDVTVEDLPREVLKENANLAGCPVSELPGTRDVDAFQVADALVPAMDNEETFAGSDMHIRIAHMDLESAEFVRTRRKKRTSYAGRDR